jgi:hypothetical protein
MSSIVERLRNAADYAYDAIDAERLEEAASTIAALRAALEPFADAVKSDDQRAVDAGYAPSFDEYTKLWRFSYGQLRAARKAYEDSK